METNYTISKNYRSTRKRQVVRLLFSFTLWTFFVKFGEGEYIPPGPKYNCPQLTQTWPCQCHSPSDDGISLNCHDVSLATLSAALAYPIAYDIPVVYLNVTQLNTEKLYGDIFKGLNSSKITIKGSQLKKIYSDVFFHVRDSLVDLEILDTELEEFPVASFQDLPLVETLVIDNHRIQKLNQKIIGLKKLTTLVVTNGNISEFSKETFAEIGSQLKRLDLHGNKLSNIPRDALKNMKKLEYFDIAFNKFNKLDPAYFFHLNRLTWLNASHNEIPQFRRGAFARNGVLRVLLLTHNKITKIDAAAFRGMRLLVRLYLSDNLISEIGRAAFNSLQRIRTIDLARNLLKVVDYQMFLKLPFCEEINLEENNITTIKTGAFNELVYININVSHNQISKIEKNAFQNCVNVTILDMSHNLIDNFTKDAFDEFTYPNEWKLQYNLLKRTKDIPLKHMIGIKILNVSHNQLEEVSKGTFPKLYELHTIDFSHNNINDMHRSVFGNVVNLRFLDLRHNNLTKLSGSAFGPITTLLQMHLDHNNLSSVSRGAFSRLASLRTLTVAHNKMKNVFQIPGGLNDLDVSHNEIDSLKRAWPGMNALQTLNLSWNNLGGNLESDSFQHLGALSRINLAGNNITEIPVEALSSLTTVQYINLTHNSISTLPKASLGRLPIVFELLLSHNNLSSIQVKAFEGLLQLLHLDLSHNQLSNIPVGAFSNLVSLRTLNLSHNALQRTDNRTNSLFEDNLSLETLDLSHNHFSLIYPHTFPELQWTNYRLSHVNLSFNQLTAVTAELLKGTRTVRKMILHHNRISELKPNVVSHMGSLQTLDLSHNSLSYLGESSLNPPTNLSVLNLSHNRLRKFPYEVLDKAPFRLLNLQANRIKSFPQQLFAKIQNGSRVLLNDNPLACDCKLVFLQRFFRELRPQLSNFSSAFVADYESFKCQLGSTDEDGVAFLKELDESQLVCDYDEDPLADKIQIPEYVDVALRSFHQREATAELRWRVRSKEDVLGFMVLSLGEGDKLLDSQSFGYNVRAAAVALLRGSRRICLVPQFSRDSLKDKYELIDEGEKISLAGKRKLCRELDGEAIKSGFLNSGAGSTALESSLKWAGMFVSSFWLVCL